MSTEQNTAAKRWRPRWSVRMLLIVVTLVCAYLACWGPTKRNSPGPLRRHLRQQRTKANIEALSRQPAIAAERPIDDGRFDLRALQERLEQIEAAAG